MAENTLTKKPVNYATEGNWESIRRCFFKVRALMVRKVIYPHGLTKKEIEFINAEIRENPEWNLHQAYTIYHILKKYQAPLRKIGFDFRTVGVPKNPEIVNEQRAVANNARGVPTITFLADKFYVRFNYSPSLVEAVKTIPGAKFDRKEKVWTVPIGSSKELERFADVKGFRIGDSARRIMIDYEDNFQQSYSAKRVELSLPFNHPQKFDLFDYQTVGVDFGIRVKRSWIADQMGLGKTIQGIGTALGINDFPWIILCPKSLRNNWKDEIETWTNYKAMIATKKNMGKLKAFIEYKMCHFLIVNYDGLKTFFVDNIEVKPVAGHKKGKKYIRLNGLERLFKGIIIDEFHELRNIRTDRFKIAHKVMNHMEYRQLLTGTPLVNGPEDIAAGLTALGLIGEFGGYQGFKKKYSNMSKGNFYGKSSPQNLTDLNIKLRSMCMVRREKHQVLTELPDKFRTVVKLDLVNRKEYDHAMVNLQDYLVKNGANDTQISNAMRAELLVSIALLKKLSMRGKMPQLIEYVKNIVEQGEKMVIFCWHKETIDLLRESFPSILEISGRVNDEEVDRAKKAFQNDPNEKLIAITYKRGGFGLTLTAANKMAMIELGWNPATQDQAEDRLHRIGQKSNVEIIYLLGKDTIDEHIYGIIEKKRVYSRESVGSTEEIETSVQEDLIKQLIKTK